MFIAAKRKLLLLLRHFAAHCAQSLPNAEGIYNIIGKMRGGIIFMIADDARGAAEYQSLPAR